MISVCMATFNGERWVMEQLLSILSQLGPDDEVIVNDDASEDSTVAIIRALGDPRVKIAVNTARVGYTQNFERALRRSVGDVIFLTDQDDVWLPEKVFTVLAALDGADFVVTDARIVDANLRELAPSHFSEFGTRTGFWRNFVATRYIGACMAFRREVLETALPFPARSDLAAHDYWLCIVAERHFRTALVRQPLMLYRRHSRTASTGGGASKNSLARKLLVRAYCAVKLGSHSKTAA